MGKKMSEAELSAWRAARTGKAVNFGGGSNGRHPGEDPVGDSPIDMLDDEEGSGGDNSPLNDNFDPTQLDNPPPTPPSPRQNDDTQQKLSAALGRVGPLQRQLQEAQDANRALADTVNALTQRIDAMTADGARAKADQEAQSFDPFAGVSATLLEQLDPAVVDAIRASSRASISTMMAKVQDPAALIEKALGERDARRLRSYLTQVSQELKLQEAADDPLFDEFSKEHGGADMLVSSLLRSASVEIAQSLKPRVAKALSAFQTWKAAKKTNDAQPSDPSQRTPGSYLKRDAAGTGDGSGRRVVNGHSDMTRLRAEHAAAVRRRDFPEAKRLLALINA